MKDSIQDEMPEVQGARRYRHILSPIPCIVLALIIGFVLHYSSAHAQRFSGDYRNYFDYGEQFYSRVLQSDDARSLDVQLNMASPMFSFLRCDRPREMQRGAYYAIRDVYIELTERGDPKVLASSDIEDTIFVKNFEETTAKWLWHPMNAVLPIERLDSSRHYIFRIEVRDGILAKLAVRPVLSELHLRSYHQQSEMAHDTLALGISDIRLFDHVDPRTGTARAVASGSTYPFSRDIEGGFSIVLPNTIAGAALDHIIASVSITQLSTIADPEDTFPRERGAVTLASANLHLDSLYSYSHADSLLIYYLQAPDSLQRLQGRHATLLFTLPGRELEQGKYRISVTVDAGGIKRSIWNLFTLIWPNMPVSLDDPRDAVNPLIHIMTDAQYKELKDSPRKELVKRLYAFWKQQDPTPNTAYNERMAAFYQRVDYAYFNFASSHSLDGAMTDRGKVYILYGPPTHIDRELLPGESPVETWTYSNNVRKKFKFTDPGSRDEYKLVDMKPL